MGLSEILSNVGSGIAKGADELGKAIPLPILSPLLRLPEHLIQQARNQAQETQLQGALSALEGTPAHSSPTLQRHLLYPTAPAQGAPREGWGLQMAGADPLLPANFQKGQPLPRPSAQEIPQGQQIAQGPPRMVPSVGGQVTVPAQPPNSKDFLKMLGSIHTPESYARLKKDDPLQYKRLMALRGIANYDQGNATAGVMDLTEAGLSPTNAIAVLQEQKNQQAMTKFGQSLLPPRNGGPSSGQGVLVLPQGSLNGGPPSGATGMPVAQNSPLPTAGDGMPLTKQEFIQKNMRSLLSLPPAMRAQGMAQITQMASTLPDRKELGPLRAQQQIPEFQQGLHLAKTAQDLQGLIADQVRKLPAAARAPFIQEIQPLLKNWQTSYAANQKESSLTGPALDLAAKQYLTTGTMPSFGMQGQKQKEAVMNRAAQMQQQEGLTPSDIVFNQNEIKVGRQALGQILKSQGMIMQYENTAYKNADLALNAADKVDRSGSPVFNRWKLAGMSAVGGSPEVARFNAANQTFVTEYAKVMSGGYGAAATSDSARMEAISMLNTAQTPGQYRAVVDQLKMEMKNRMQAMKDTRTFIETGMKNAISGKKPESVTPTGGLPQGAIPGTYKGQKGYLLNGHFYVGKAS